MTNRPLTDEEWEAAWAPYDAATYRSVLSFLRPDDVVLDIGAGDLRLARQAAVRVRRVFAIERRFDLLSRPRPSNLIALCADALTLPLFSGVTVGLLLMRHCRHFAHYVRQLRAAGCQRLITNARWGMDVECISLAPQARSAAPGWYACLCGAVGFVPGVSEVITATLLQRTQSLETCPACSAPADAPA